MAYNTIEDVREEFDSLVARLFDVDSDFPNLREFQDKVGSAPEHLNALSYIYLVEALQDIVLDNSRPGVEIYSLDGRIVDEFVRSKCHHVLMPHAVYSIARSMAFRDPNVALAYLAAIPELACGENKEDIVIAVGDYANQLLLKGTGTDKALKVIKVIKDNREYVGRLVCSNKQLLNPYDR